MARFAPIDTLYERFANLDTVTDSGAAAAMDSGAAAAMMALVLPAPGESRPGQGRDSWKMAETHVWHHFVAEARKSIHFCPLFTKCTGKTAHFEWTTHKNVERKVGKILESFPVAHLPASEAKL